MPFLNLNEIKKHNPDFLIIRKVRTGRMCWKKKLYEEISFKKLNFQNDIVCNPGYGIGEVEAKELLFNIISNPNYEILSETDLVLLIKIK